METRKYTAADIESIASKVLGKTADGKTMMRYETPDAIDPTLLVGIPRYLNREQYDIQDDNLPFVGVDAWNGYEFSCLLNNGFPVSGWLKWVYSASSENIVESKSIKLYLNSFNMAKMGNTVEEAQFNVERQIYQDLEPVLRGMNSESDLRVYLHLDESMGSPSPFHGTFTQLEECVPVETLSFNRYNEDPTILDVVYNERYVDRYQSKSLRSNCRVTNQPDWGDIFIYIKGEKTITPESLLEYIVSMRKENHFHEEICECVYKRLHDLLSPEELMVGCLYTRRGGIDINPVRTSSLKLLGIHPITSASRAARKTQRQ